MHYKKMILLFGCFSIIFFALAVLQNQGFSQEERKLQIAIVGSIENNDPQYNPYVICSPKEVKLLLLEMAESPMKREEIESRLTSSKTKINDLLRLEIIRQEKDLFYINFPLFTQRDEEIIVKAAEKYSQHLKENILKKRDQTYDLLDKYQPSGIGKDKLAFIAVSCLSLDLGALDFLAENGYIIHRPEKPGGNHYVLNAEEVTDFSLKEIYWGCHSDSIDNVMFMTFGDHHQSTRRYGFPDILWGLGRGFSLNVPELYKRELLILFNDQTDNLMKEIVDVICILKNSSLNLGKIQESSSSGEEKLKHILDFLTKINYVTVKDEVYSLAIPVFGEADKAMLEDIKEIVNGEISSWLDSCYEQIKIDLRDISAVKNRVNYKETFNMLWHYFFGYTNKFLAHSGFIYDTYQAPDVQRGYLPAVLINKF